MTSLKKGTAGLLAIGFMIGSVGITLAAEKNESAAPTAQEAADAGLPAPGQGNRPPTAVEMQQMMGPVMAEMMSSMLKGMTKTLAEPQIAQNLATFTRNYYQALMDRGFTEEQALKIVTSTGFPSMGGAK